MGVQFINFLDGPCHGQGYEWTKGRVPEEVRCGGTIYTYSLPRSEGVVWIYVVKGGPNDDWSGGQVRGRRDVFVAFRRLMRVLAKDSPRRLREVRRAGKRIRRAVR